MRVLFLNEHEHIGEFQICISVPWTLSYQYCLNLMKSLKLNCYLPKINCFVCFDESPLNTMKNAFYFILKALFVIKIFKVFVLIFWWCRKSGLIRAIRLISKFMTSQPGYIIITIHILPNISRSKGNQTMKFGQATEHHKENIFFQKPCRKWGRKTSSRRLFVF